MKHDINYLMKQEIAKMRGQPVWRLYKIVNPRRVEYELDLLKDVQIRSRKMPIQRNHMIVAYKIEVLE